MPIAFAICFFIFVGLSETLRQGVFGLNPSETDATLSAALLLCALIVLRTDIVHTVRQPKYAIYGRPSLNWAWSRSVLGLVFGLGLIILPVAISSTLIQINFEEIFVASEIELLVLQGIAAALCIELFFREAAVKAFAGHFGAMALASTLAYFVFRLPLGLADALIAAGAGLYLLTLRLIGTNILLVAVVATVFAAVLNRTLAGFPDGFDMLTYAIYFTVASMILSLTAFSLFSQKSKEFQNA